MMFRRKHIYGILIGWAALLAGCDDDSAALSAVVQTERQPIAFDCHIAQESAGATRAVVHEGIYNVEDLHTTGFGVFASQAADHKPDFMYNQHVMFTHVGDMDTKHGYWSYSPVKYWPNTDGAKVTFSAYAPYVEAPSASTGIIAMTDNATEPRLTYVPPLHPEDCTDLMWGCLETTKDNTVTIVLRHALARIRLSMKLHDDSSVPSGTKVLVRRVTLSGITARSGQLSLASTGNTPTWTNLDMGSRTVYIDCAPPATDNDNYYGLVADSIRYIEGLPYRWQPDGLVKGAYHNVLTTIDRLTYLYLIPQSSLTLSCTIDYLLVNAEGTTSGTKTNEKILDAKEIEGNNTYNLQVDLKI